MHFVLEAGHVVGGVAVGIELVVEFEDHAVRIFGVGEGLEMPGGLLVDGTAIANEQANGGDGAVKLGHDGVELESFSGTGSEGRRRFRGWFGEGWRSGRWRPGGRGRRRGDRRIFNHNRRGIFCAVEVDPSAGKRGDEYYDENRYFFAHAIYETHDRIGALCNPSHRTIKKSFATGANARCATWLPAAPDLSARIRSMN